MKNIFATVIIASALASGSAVASPESEHNGYPVLSTQARQALAGFVALDETAGAKTHAGGRLSIADDPARGAWSGK